MQARSFSRGWFAASLVTQMLGKALPVAAEEDVTSLAKTTQNPVGDLTAIPFQFNFNEGGDLEDRTLFNLNFQPVIPFALTPRWNVIARTIVPVLSIPLPGDDRARGIGDIQEQLFLTPARPGGLIWGLGPVLSFPTATAEPARTGSWAAGPAAVVVKTPGHWVLGALATQLWTYADDGSALEVNQFLLQPFINYNFGKGWALSSAPILTANWGAVDGEEWTVPLGIGLTRTFVFNARPMSLGVQYYRNVERPAGTAANQLRAVVSLLYPRKAPAR